MSAFYKVTDTGNILESPVRVVGPGFALRSTDSSKPAFASKIDGWWWATSRDQALADIGVTSATFNINVTDLSKIRKVQRARELYNAAHPGNTLTMLQFIWAALEWAIDQHLESDDQ